MDRDEALALFESLTSAPPHVAEHILDAHGWDVNSAVEWYLESGGVGHGNHQQQPFGDAGAGGFVDVGAGAFGGGGGMADAGAGGAAPGSPPPMLDEPEEEVVVEDDEVLEQPAFAAGGGGAGGGARSGGRRGAAASRPLPAAARPRSSPIEILDDDDDDVQVLASSLGRRRPPSRTDELMEEDDAGAQRVGSVEEDLEDAMGRRVRRNRRRVAGELDRDLEMLGRRFGVMPEYQPAPTSAQQQQPGRQGPGQGPLGGGQGQEGDVPLLPDDVDLEEQRMLMAAIQGGGYEGQLPDFQNDPRYQPRMMSPGAQARQNLREEQDAAYYESLRADREREEAAERSRREAAAAASAAAAAAEAESRRQAEEAERVEREMRSKQAGLPAEPPADAADAINVAVRLPAGGRYSRRFSRSDSLQAVYDFVDVQSWQEAGGGGGGGGGGEPAAIQPGSYSLAASYPRRVLQDGPSAAGMSLADAGLTAKQEALFLEIKS